MNLSDNIGLYKTGLKGRGAVSRKVQPLVRCSCESSHTPCPSGYVEWFEWASEMSKTHKQIRCKGCGKFMVWIPNI